MAVFRRERVTALLATALALASVEGALRIARYGDRRPGELGERDGLPWPRATAGVNRLGFRDREWGPRAPGVRRVAVLGDSFVFGVGVRDDETLPAALGRELAARGERAEVLDLGIPGLNAQQEAIVAERLLPSLRPDVVVLVGVSNDAEAMPWQPDPWTSCGLAVPVDERLDHALLGALHLYRPLHAALVRDGCDGPRRCAGTGFLGDAAPARCFRRSLAAIARAAKDAGATLFAFEYPHYPTAASGGRSTEGELAAAYRRAGLPSLPTRDALDGQPHDRLLAASRDGHPSGLAHALVARAVADGLVRFWSTGALPAGGDAGGWAIGPGQDALLERLLGGAPGGCAFDGASVDKSRVLARYRCGGGEVALALAHPDEGAAALATTARFRIESAGSVAPPATLVEALARHLRDGEAAFAWTRADDAARVSDGARAPSSDAELRLRRRLALAIVLLLAVAGAAATGRALRP